MPHSTTEPQVPATPQYDLRDAELYGRYCWYVNALGYLQRAGAVRRSTPPVLFHREILGLGRRSADDKRVVDHIDGDKLNNRRANLRIVSIAYNIQNRKRANCNSKTGVRGVSWDTERQRYVAGAKVNRKRYALGRYPTIDEARAVVRAWCRENMPGYIDHA